MSNYESSRKDSSTFQQNKMPFGSLTAWTKHCKIETSYFPFSTSISHHNNQLSSTFTNNRTILLLTCIYLSLILTCSPIHCDTITIPSNSTFYTLPNDTPTFGTFKVTVSYAVSPSTYLQNISFSLMYLNVNSYTAFLSDPSAFEADPAKFDGEIDLFQSSKPSGSIQISEMRFTENTKLNQYKYIIRKKEKSLQYTLAITKFTLEETWRVYDRLLLGMQSVDIPSGLTEKYVCEVCSSRVIDVNELDAKVSYTVTVSPYATGRVSLINVKLSTQEDLVWSSDQTLILKDSRSTLTFTTNSNSIKTLYVQVTALNCSLNDQILDRCQFSFNVKPVNSKSLTSASADTAIVVTAVILSLIILLAILLSSGYFYYRYRMSKRYEEARLQTMREMTSRAQLSLANGSNVQTVDESQRPHDPFVRLDKLHGYSLDSSTHFVMDALPKVNINLATTPTTPEPVVQYGVDTKRLSQRVSDAHAPIETDSIKLAVQNEKDHK
ncbi:predicted protein [Naegleria gruberi]|uniref:Predicted protein n=1 Tax=Naegleria gruberi TaxID=5762 RepID=D2VRU1_NAEGR|nr:uncharacterized protein NAEGRDRAFT_71703 [Naegleria gruberi]EFC40523.1 predicted protein [Naegleria gruberi]|eukprot:XP_002673267.1 predicted protein [Naegleria gruberi strain NEG-M]